MIYIRRVKIKLKNGRLKYQIQPMRTCIISLTGSKNVPVQGPGCLTSINVFVLHIWFFKLQ